LQKFLFNMSNKISSVFRLKKGSLKSNLREYSFFRESEKDLLYCLILPFKVYFKRCPLENSFKISVDNLGGRFRKTLKKKLGFFSHLLKRGLRLKNPSIIRRIILIGTGFKVFRGRRLEVEHLLFKIGLSHLVKISIPVGINFKLIKKKKEIQFDSLDKELIGSFLNFVASIRFPDAYKGRGLRISNHPQVKFKRGKVKN
jgi:hypothetical protein